MCVLSQLGNGSREYLLFRSTYQERPKNRDWRSRCSKPPKKRRCLGSVDRQTDRQTYRSAAYLGVLDLQLREGNEVLLEVLYPPRLEVLDF